LYVSLAESPAVPKAIAELTPSQTLTYPKPLVEFANKPMIQHQIEALADAGVTDVVLAVNYRPEIMAEALKTVSIPVQL
jgi:NDP-sugar pyrophosphorylase family protein